MIKKNIQNLVNFLGYKIVKNGPRKDPVIDTDETFINIYKNVKIIP